MTATVGTISSASGTASSATSNVALQAQLDRCVNQLGDWTSCSSGKTPEGQRIIAALEQKIGSLKAQIQTTNSSSSGNNANNNTTNSNPASTGAVTPPASLALASIGNLGTLLNTVA